MSISQPGTDARRTLGRWGEQFAAEHLAALGWTVLERNWRCRIGEIDIIGLEPVPGAAPVGVAVEVKCRSQLQFGDPFEAITPDKQARLRKLIVYWASGCGLRLSQLRVDAIGVVKPSGQAPTLHHLRGVA